LQLLIARGRSPFNFEKGKRFRAAIKEASHALLYPSSISIGIATYPQHGGNTNELVDVAEAALKRAKAEGKDRVILAE